MVGRCSICGGYFVSYHNCIEGSMKLEDIKKVLLEVGHPENDVMVASNGLFYNHDDFQLHIKDSFKLAPGLHKLGTLEENKVDTIDVTRFETLYFFGEENVSEIQWKKVLGTIGIESQALNVLLYLLVTYRVEDRIQMVSDDDYYFYNGRNFKMLMEYN